MYYTMDTGDASRKRGRLPPPLPLRICHKILFRASSRPPPANPLPCPSRGTGTKSEALARFVY